MARRAGAPCVYGLAGTTLRGRCSSPRIVGLLRYRYSPSRWKASTRGNSCVNARPASRRVDVAEAEVGTTAKRSWSFGTRYRSMCRVGEVPRIAVRRSEQRQHARPGRDGLGSMG